MKELNLKIEILSFFTKKNLQQISYLLLSFFVFQEYQRKKEVGLLLKSAVHVGGTHKQGFKNIPRTRRIGNDKDKNSNSVFYFKIGPLYLNN